MVQFAKRLLEARYGPWEEYYLNYKRLKKILKYHPEAFQNCLEEEVEKVVLFFLQIQGQFASQLLELNKKKADILQLDRSEELEPLKLDYNRIGQEIIQFVYFCELNTTGLRKILKKHDKKLPPPKALSKTYLESHQNSNYYFSSEAQQQSQTDSHLQQLFHYGGIAALVATIRSALSQIGIHKRKQKQLQVQAESNDSDNGVVLYGSISVTASVEDDEVYVMYEPILEKIDAARRRLRQSTEYVRAIAAQALIFTGDESSHDDDVATDELFDQIQYGQVVSPQKAVPKEDIRLSSLLNLLSTFLYMTNYYIIAPTSGQYATKLGCSATLSGIIIGMTPCAAMVSAVLYSWWANRSYKNALLFASFCSLIGNILYALALPMNNLWYVIIGRLLNGFGGARAINRRYIADTCRREDRTAASAAFVTAGALGMAAGPAIASIVGLATTSSHHSNTFWTAETAPGWIMFLLWLIYLNVAYHYFQEPLKCRNAMIKKQLELTFSSTETNSLISSSRHQNNTSNQHHDQITVDNVESNIQNYHPSPSKPEPLYKNVPVMATLWIYFVLKLVLECLLSSTAMVTKFYFQWDDAISGLFLALLGLTMFPANMALAQLSRLGHEDRYIILVSLMAVFLGTIGILSYFGTYSTLQFIVFGLCIFISTNILEGVNMSLLSKVIPKELAAQTFNSGFLATEAGTLGRAVGDMLISAAGALSGIQNMLNVTFIPLTIVVLVTTTTTWKYYPSLKPKYD